MAAPGNLNPLFDLVSVSYELINRNTLQPISHSGNCVEVNNSQFIFLKVHPQLTSFDKRAKKVLLTFKQYTNLNYQVYLSESNTAHLISSNQIPLRKYTSNNTICYLENVLLEETVTETINNVQQTDTLRYLYDTNNEVIGFSMNDNTYLYVKDMFKNVIAITNQAGVEMCQYYYDAYGNFIITASITGGEILGELNPIRYRSYYYDKETGLYYLKTRYYDPETCRFISMDDVSYLDPQTLNGLNLYTYCGNDPINKVDPNGQFWISLIVCTILGAVTGLAAAAYSDYKADGIWFNGKWQDYAFEIGLGAVTGAIGGGFGSFFSTSNFIAGLVLSTSLGTGSQIISDYYYGNLNSNSKWYDILFSGIKGGMVAGSSYALSFGVTRFLASKEFTRIVGINTSNHHINQALGNAGLAGKIGQVGKSGIIRELMNSKSFDNFNMMFNWLLDTFFVGLSQ